MCQMHTAKAMYPNARTILRATNSTQLITRNQLRATSSARPFTYSQWRASECAQPMGGIQTRASKCAQPVECNQSRASKFAQARSCIYVHTHTCATILSSSHIQSWMLFDYLYEMEKITVQKENSHLSWVCSEEETTLSFSSTLSRPRQLRLTHLNEVIPPARILSLLNMNPPHDI